MAHLQAFQKLQTKQQHQHAVAKCSKSAADLTLQLGAVCRLLFSVFEGLLGCSVL